MTAFAPETRSPVWVGIALVLGACNGVSPGPVPESLVGTWGGADAGFIVTDTSAHAHVGCTYGAVHQPIEPDPSGRFDVAGEYNINAYPVDLGILHPARFIGVVDGRRMLLTVVLTDTTVSLGPVTVIYGRTPGMRICPICQERDLGRQDGRTAGRQDSTGRVPRRTS